MHEHQRPDRDDFVNIHWENIIEKHKMDFIKATRNEYQENYVGYDPNSLMHYGADAFSKNGRQTITFKSESEEINTGQRLRPTTKDMMGICRAYGCEQTCGNELEICDNGSEAYFARDVKITE